VGVNSPEKPPQGTKNPSLHLAVLPDFTNITKTRPRNMATLNSLNQLSIIFYSNAVSPSFLQCPVIYSSLVWILDSHADAVIMSAVRSRCGHVFVLWFLLFFPCPISAVGDWMSTISRGIVTVPTHPVK